MAAHVLLICLAAILLLALLAEMPWMPRQARAVLLEADVVLLGTGLVGAGIAGERLSVGALRGPGLWAIALLAWCAVSAATAPYRAFAVAEFLRLLLGVGVGYAAAFVLRPHETRLLPYPLLGLGAAVGLFGLFEFGAGADAQDGIHSLFGNHEQFGSFLALLLPPALALALDRERPLKELLFSQGCALILGAALLLARTRSAWAGAAVGCILLSVLALRFAPMRLNRSNKFLVVGPALIVLLGFGGLLAFSQLAPLVSARAASFAHLPEDVSLTDRLHRWRAACRMASERPITGWGLGAFPVIQGRWTHQGDDVSEVLAAGTGHSNLAHNFWAQWAAETGGVGLLLHVGLMAAFFAMILRALARADRERRTLLLASAAAVASGCVDMAGAPSYTFPGVSSLLWVWLGLGVAMAREPRGASPPPLTFPGQAASVGAGILAALAVLGIGWRLRAEGAIVPRGTLTVTAEPPGPVAPGARVLWSATYHAPNGSLRPTAPGTVWTVDANRLDKASPTYLFANADPERSGWQGNVRAYAPQATVTAHYWDNFSREYAVSQTVVVNPGKNPNTNPQ